jgi:hypothetical protein
MRNTGLFGRGVRSKPPFAIALPAGSAPRRKQLLTPTNPNPELLPLFAWKRSWNQRMEVNTRLWPGAEATEEP